MIYRKLVLKVSYIKLPIEPAKILPMKLPPKAPSKPSDYAKARSGHELEVNVDDRADVYSQASGEIFKILVIFICPNIWTGFHNIFRFFV
jgi:hypothetical protein